MRLIDNWRQAWRMFSVQALAIIGAVQSVLLVLPPETLARPALGLAFTWSDFGTAVTIASAAFGAVGRLIDQPKANP
jgi:membrane protein YqaA with SNARE-associated domain